MGRSISFCALALVLVVACGGATASESGSSDAATDPSIACGVLADSGVTVMRCIAASCCQQLTVCVGEPDGQPYVACSQKCTYEATSTSPDTKSCTDACNTAHPQGAALCSPYLDCVIGSCAPGR